MRALTTSYVAALTINIPLKKQYTGKNGTIHCKKPVKLRRGQQVAPEGVCAAQSQPSWESESSDQDKRPVVQTGFRQDSQYCILMFSGYCALAVSISL